MPDPMSSPERTPREEIAALERLLDKKKLALAAEGKAPPEREVFREAFRETYGEALAPQAVPPSTGPGRVLPPALPPDESAQHADDIKAKEREGEIEALVALAFSKGVRAAADAARSASPWLMDELHDRLADHYYQHLVQLKQMKAL